MICSVSKLISIKNVTTSFKKHVTVVYVKKTCLLNNNLLSNKQVFINWEYIPIKPKMIC